MLNTGKLVAFALFTDTARTRDFYGRVLGLTLANEDEYALVYDVNGSPLRLSRIDRFVPGEHTVAGWLVDDIRATVADLAQRGVSFSRYAGLQQDELGIWAPGNGDRVAWFKDPDGNVLSVTQLG